MSRIRVLGLALVCALLATGCSVLDRGGSYDVVAYFPRAVSVYEEGAVQVLGLPAGEVTDVEVVGDLVRITMAIDDDIPVPMDVKAAIVPQSLIGERRIQLFPPFQEGDQTISDGYEIAAEDTVIPVEPDEALAALNDFLENLDPNGLGRLIDNAATTLDGQGENLGAALDELSELVGNIEENDDDIIAIADRFDDFTETLLTRESQLAQALDDFAVVADVLADERDDIELLITSLADLSGDGLDLVSEHAVRLRTDVEILTRLARSIDTNLDGLQDTLDAGPALIGGFIDAYNPELRALDLRNNFTPLIQEALGPIAGLLPVPLPCVSALGTNCPSGGALGLEGGEGAVAADLGAIETEREPADAPTGPINDILDVLGTPTGDVAVPADAPSSSSDDGNVVSRFLGTFLGVGA